MIDKQSGFYIHFLQLFTHYINFTRDQVTYIKDVMDALNETACKFVNSNASIYCYLFENVS